MDCHKMEIKAIPSVRQNELVVINDHVRRGQIITLLFDRKYTIKATDLWPETVANLKDANVISEILSFPDVDLEYEQNVVEHLAKAGFKGWAYLKLRYIDQYLENFLKSISHTGHGCYAHETIEFIEPYLQMVDESYYLYAIDHQLDIFKFMLYHKPASINTLRKLMIHPLFTSQYMARIFPLVKIPYADLAFYVRLCIRRHEYTLWMLLQHMPSRDYTKELLLCCEVGFVQGITFFVKKGADPSCKNNAPLQIAVKKNDNNAIRNLLQLGATMPEWLEKRRNIPRWMKFSEEKDKCAICLDDGADVKCIANTCTIKTHSHCAISWYSISKRCPYCAQLGT